MELVLRGIERQEVAAAVALVAASTLSPGVEDPARSDEYWDAVLETRRGGGELLVALSNGVVVGMCQVIIFRHFQRIGARCCELESVYVHPEWRGHGVGAALVAFAEEFARQRGCYRVQLTSRNEREDAHRFYRTQGFSQMSQGFKKSLID